MTIKYTLTRAEIVRSYFRSLANSPKFLGTILIYSVGLGLLSLAMRGAFSRSVTSRDVLIAVAWMLGAFAFMPVWLYIRGKTDERTLTVSEEGISTEIGSHKGQVPWSKVKLIADAGQHLLVVGRGGNAFFIPNRALFLKQLEGWLSPG